MNLDVRYARSFLKDLNHLEPSTYQRMYNHVFVEIQQIDSLYDLPELHSLDSSQIFYRFTFDQYLIGIEVIGQIIKFIRILPKPKI